MKHLLLGVLLLLTPRSSLAYILPVIDVANLAVNTSILGMESASFAKHVITAAKLIAQVKLMADQVANSDAEVQMMGQNLILTEGVYYPMVQYLRVLQEVVESKRRGESMHYYLPALDHLQQDLYRGYTGETKGQGWRKNYDLLAETNFNVQRGVLNTVHEELRPEDDVKLEDLLYELRTKTEGAAGNLDVNQAANYLQIQQVQEQRRQRHMIGALTNAIVIQNQHETNLDAWRQHMTDRATHLSATPVPGYIAAGGVYTLGQ